MIRTLSIAVGLLLLGACTTTRVVTDSRWVRDGSGAYVAYVEGKQMNFTDSKVMFCRVRDDNTLDCQNQPEAEALLNP